MLNTTSGSHATHSDMKNPTKTVSDSTLIQKLHDPSFHIPDWLYNSLGLRNPRKMESLRPFYDFLMQDALRLEGDVAEFGVFRGDSLLSTGLLLKRMGLKKKVHGFDTFAGFPAREAQDQPEVFERLYKEGKITASHYENVLLLREAEAMGLYKQHQFQSTSEELVKGRIQTLKLDNVEVYTGEFKDTVGKVDKNVKYCAVLMDSDLYPSYRHTLEECWKRMVPGAIMYLDEYYSLKYPGPRVAVDEFCRDVCTTPERVLCYSERGEFERWYLRKPLYT